ncbi:hypothetical protein LXL04_015237 [Taraxacum kok-saghyz]
MYQVWTIRPSNHNYNSTSIYGYLFSIFTKSNPTMFSIEIHHGGKFIKNPGIKYVEGQISCVDLLDIEDFSVKELDSIMQKLGYTSPPVIYYHFQIPRCGLEFGLRPLRNGDDILNLAQYIGDNKLIRVYTEHGLDQGTPQPYVGSYMDLILCDSLSKNGSPEAKRKRRENLLQGQSSCSKKLFDNVDNVLSGEEHPPEYSPFDECDFSNINELDEPFIELEADVDMSDFNLNLNMDDKIFGGHEMLDRMDEAAEIEDLEVIDNNEWDSLGDDSDEDRRRRSMLKEIVKEKKMQFRQSFYIGQKFKTKQELKEKIELHALESRRNLVFKKNDKKRLRAICIGFSVITDDQSSGSTKGKGKEVNSQNPSCPWVLHASRTDEESDWFVKTFKYKHTCMQTRTVRACTATFISKQIMNEVELNPTVPLRALQDQFERKYEVGVSMDKIFRAKAAATKMVVGDYTKQYDILRDYCLELQSTNPDTTVKIEVYSDANPSSLSRQFKRIYVCLGPLKKGFKACMRDLLGLDGAFMKGPFPGQILTAVGMDSNNGIYPLAYAIVEAENKSSWKWFLDCLGDDLEMGSNSNFTFVTDRQKGLVPALAEMFPQAEHRYCLRHIHENMKKKWKLTEYKIHLWNCAKASTIPEFEHFMREFDHYDREACDWVKKISYKQWSKSHFTGRAKSDVVLNNMCEVLNSKLEYGRDMPIISCLEFVRQYLMKRICNVLKVQGKCIGPLTPTATNILERNMSLANRYKARWNGGGKYEVRWELTGIPCKHSIAALHEINKNTWDYQDIYKWVDKLYWLDTWKKAYEFKIEPVKGRSMWPKSEVPIKLTLPPHHNQVGRPKKKRKRSEEERLTQC